MTPVSHNDDNPSHPKKGCPHFGIVGDPDTRSLYPSSQGCCYRAEPPEVVKLAHQQSHCLTAQYEACPMFRQREPQPLPSSLRGTMPKVAASEGNNTSGVGRGIALIMLVLLVGGIGSIWFLTNTEAAEEPVGMAGLAAATASRTATVTPEPTATATLLAETAVILPSSTPAASPTPRNSPTPLPTATPSPAATATMPPTPSPTATPVVYPFALLDETDLALRTGPGVGYPLLGRIAEAGALVEIVGRSGNGRWWQVCCLQGEAGWVRRDELPVSGAEAATPAPTVDIEILPQAIVQAARLNVRQGPGTDFEVVGLVELDDRYEVIGRNEDDSWWQICCINEENGWVTAEAIAITGQVTEVPVVGDQ